MGQWDHTHLSLVSLRGNTPRTQSSGGGTFTYASSAKSMKWINFVHEPCGRPAAHTRSGGGRGGYCSSIITLELNHVGCYFTVGLYYTQ